MGILRFLLALTVVVVHSSSLFGFSFVGGQIAVQAFYIISGFYMTLILNEKYIGVNNSYKLFITNRFLRLFPVYWIILFLTILFSFVDFIYFEGVYFQTLSQYAKYIGSMNFTSIFFLLFTNIFLLLQDAVMFLGLNTSSGYLFFTPDFQKTTPMLYGFLFIPQAWTIGVEVSFYLIAPFLVKSKIIYIIPLIFLSLLLRYVLQKVGFNADPWSYRFFPTELVFFLLGILSYAIYVKVRTMEIDRLFLKMVFAGMLFFTIFFNFLPIPGKYPLYLSLFFICLPFIFILTSKWKKDSYIGELSYPMYISHIFLLRCITMFNLPIVGNLGLTLAITTILFSIFLNMSVAKRIEKIRQKRVKAI